jgi:hypothetical protein
MSEPISFDAHDRLEDLTAMAAEMDLRHTVDWVQREFMGNHHHTPNHTLKPAYREHVDMQLPVEDWRPLEGTQEQLSFLRDSAQALRPLSPA